jgi:predicted dehydrogenase
LAEDAQIMATYGQRSDVAGAGAADPSAIDFRWHQANFEDALRALRDNSVPSVDGRQARRAVALILAIYESARSGGARIEVG